jgi:hypothetical protein
MKAEEGEGRTYTAPIQNNAISPILLFPPSLRPFRNGAGSRNTSTSNNIFVAECAAQLAKKTFGSLLPHATHVPLRAKFQFFAIGRQEKSARRKKLVPQRATMTMRIWVERRATRDCMSKRRRYWRRMASLMKVALAQ